MLDMPQRLVLHDFVCGDKKEKKEGGREGRKEGGGSRIKGGRRIDR